MIKKHTIAAMAAIVLLIASIGSAQTKPAPAAAKPAKVTTHVMNGTVESVSGSGDAMSIVVKGSGSSDKPVTLMLTSATTKSGDLVQGAKVNAHYRVDGGQNVATSITAKPAPAPKKK